MEPEKCYVVWDEEDQEIVGVYRMYADAIADAIFYVRGLITDEGLAPVDPNQSDLEAIGIHVIEKELI